MHVPHKEVEMDSGSHTDHKADILEHHNTKNDRGKRIPFRISKGHPDCEELGLILKSTTDEHSSPAVTPKMSEGRYAVAGPTDLSLIVIPDSADAIPKSPV